MRKIIIAAFLAFALTILTIRRVYAQENISDSSAALKNNNLITINDYRIVNLERYLKAKGSPLSQYAKEFVIYADKYGIDYRLVPAITGVESNFGKKIPKNSYNAYGWNGGNYKFTSWPDSINEVSRTLRFKYIEKGAITIDQIAKIYCPPSNSWAGKVKYFIEKIDPLPLNYDF